MNLSTPLLNDFRNVNSENNYDNIDIFVKLLCEIGDEKVKDEPPNDENKKKIKIKIFTTFRNFNISRMQRKYLNERLIDPLIELSASPSISSNSVPRLCDVHIFRENIKSTNNNCLFAVFNSF